MQHILLFGGRGFVGAHLAPLLREGGGSEVVIVDRDTALTPEHLAVDSVVVMTQPGVPVKDILLPALASGKVPARIIYLSSLLVYPDAVLPQDETTAPVPLTLYEKGKYEEERLFSEVARKRGISLAIVRLGNLYGDVQNRGVVHELFISVLTGKPFTGFGDFQNIKRDYLFIEDAVAFLRQVILTPPTARKDILNLCSGTGSTLAQVMKTVESLTGMRITVLTKPPKDEKRSVIGNPAKFSSLSGLRPQLMLADGLRKTYENYRKLYTAL